MERKENKGANGGDFQFIKRSVRLSQRNSDIRQRGQPQCDSSQKGKEIKMYSWDRDLHEKKYESIQHGYEVAEYYDEEELDVVEVSLEEMLELEDEELEEMEMAV